MGPHLSQIYTSFTMMRFLLLLAFATMAFAECPAPKQCADDEYPCTGPYDEKTGCYTYDTCMPYKDQYGCPTNCEMFCSEDGKLCPGGVDAQGCYQGEYCAPSYLDFCPAMCFEVKYIGTGEMKCPGHRDFYSGKQISPDYCIPRMNGDCPANCPVQCRHGEMWCPGAVDENGCQQAANCLPKDMGCPKY